MRLMMVLLVLFFAASASAGVIYVDIDALGANDGTSWADAYVDLQDALARAVTQDEIWVAEGVYIPIQVQDPSASFSLGNGVRVLGGFRGFESQEDERRPDQHACTLSGKLGEIDGGPVHAEFLVTADQCDDTTVLSGFALTESFHAISVFGGSPRFEDLLVVHNRARDWTDGAGAVIDGGGRPTFYKVDFLENWAGAGGAVCVGQRAGGGRPRFEHVLFQDNFAALGSGGAVHGVGDFLHVEFRDNHADGWGGGLAGGGTLTNVVFVGNNNYSSPGGGMSGHGTLTNVHFIGNSSGLFGGGFLGGGTLTNLVFEDNLGVSGGGGAIIREGSSISGAIFRDNGAIGARALLIGFFPPPAWPEEPDEPSGVATVLTNITVAGFTLASSPAGPPPFFAAPIMSETGDIVVRNSIIWADASGPEGISPVYAHAGQVRVSHSTIRDCGGSGEAWNSVFGVDLGGNLDTDPLFVDAEKGNFRLRAGSPAIDSGDTDALSPDLLTDLDGNPRVIGAAVDMGAYEASVPGQAGLFSTRFAPPVLYPDAPGADVLVAVEPLWDFGVDRIDPTSLLLNEFLAPAAVKVGPRQLRVLFSRESLVSTLAVGSAIPVKLSGNLIDGTPFTAADELTVLGSRGGPVAPSREGAETDILSRTAVPRYSLVASPNPFNPSTTIRYGMAEAGPADLVIYDLAGRRVKRLVSGYVPAGEHEFVWDGRDARGGSVGSGVYLAKFNTSGFERTIRLVLLK